MKKLLILIGCCIIATVSTATAGSYSAHLLAGSSLLDANLSYQRPLASGHMTFGGGLVVADRDNQEYRTANLSVTVGNQSLAPGLQIDVGVKSVFGKAERNPFEGDVGMVGFTAEALYTFPDRLIPIPVEVFGKLTFAPSVLSFFDLDTYTEYEIGAGVRIVDNASIFLAYRNYRFEMNDSPGDWTLKDDVVLAGLRLHF